MWTLNRRTLVLILLIIFFADFFAFLILGSVNQYLAREIKRVEAQAHVDTTERIVFNKALVAGTTLGSEDLAVRALPAELAPAESYVPESYERLVGQVLKYSVHGGEVVLPLHVRAPRQDSFAQRIQSGRRALSIAVDRINSISGLVRPGDLIDIYVSFDYQRRKITAPLLQGVYVLATDQTTQEQEHTRKGITTLTLDLDPEDAAKLVAAKQSAEITAMLRNPIDDDTSVKAVRNDIATLLGLRNPIENLNQGRRVNIIYGNTHQGKDTVGPLRPDRVYRAPPAVFDLQVPFHLSHGQSVEGYEWQAEMDLMSVGYE